MTLVEMLIAVLLVGVALFLLVGWSRGLRLQSQRAQAQRMLAALDQSLALYFEAERTYPPTRDNDPGPVIMTLLRYPRTRALADALPPTLWTASAPRTLLDPWGTPLQYDGDLANSEVVRANGGRPVFASAGADRQFGTTETIRMVDDLRSDDPGVSGFRAVASGS